MARKADVDRARKHLAIGAEALKDSLPEVAETLLALREPFGHRLLVQDRVAPRGPEGSTNVAIQVPTHLRTAIQAAAVKAAVEADPSVRGRVKVLELLGRVLSGKIRQVLDGSLSPAEIPRDPRNAAVAKVNLNVPVDTGVLAELREVLPELGERLHFEGKASVAKIGLRLLLDEYGLPYEPSPNEFKDLAQIQLQVPPALAAAVQEKLALMAEGEGPQSSASSVLRMVIEEGYAKVLDGSWRPFKIPKASRGSDYERTSLLPRVKATLVEQVRAKCPELKAELGYAVTPPTIAIDYLIDQFGLQDLADAEYGITAG